ncbi:methyltransferase domain-containing protein [Rubellimicrobium rubrum]|uniref:Methyltransferase domain-containing protein n=1 Tax=Rubellimicrobium rubrum TaxID=2585369 RepID=A0A5C4N148_9RHOB|nr:class I SAM-dependent methyltransferase [Rubellimicrobium rubrum]TNC50142.1 methyltransferase domain-containing protein [Rubellimicrobium rubrum]
MTTASAGNAAQAEYWSSPSGRLWIDHEAALDATLEPALAVLMEAAAPHRGEEVLDVGCGTGASTLRLAELVGAGHVTALDIAEPLLARARERAERAGHGSIRFLRADAQTHDLGPGRFDLILSRFGVMFFEDTVAAFRNLGRVLRPGGRIAVVAWAGVEQNPWFLIPQAAAVERLGSPPAIEPGAPGPLAFADRDHVVALLRAAGLTDVRSQERHVMLTPPGDVQSVARLTSRVGPAARILRLREGSGDDVAAIESAVAERLGGFESGGTVRVPATLNLFLASA